MLDAKNVKDRSTSIHIHDWTLRLPLFLKLYILSLHLLDGDQASLAKVKLNQYLFVHFDTQGVLLKVLHIINKAQVVEGWNYSVSLGKSVVHKPNRQSILLKIHVRQFCSLVSLINSFDESRNYWADPWQLTCLMPWKNLSLKVALLIAFRTKPN